VKNYIVRIYRFEKDNPRNLVGIVESVEGERREKRAFFNIDDLLEILNFSDVRDGPPSAGGTMADRKWRKQKSFWKIRPFSLELNKKCNIVNMGERGEGNGKNFGPQ